MTFVPPWCRVVAWLALAAGSAWGQSADDAEIRSAVDRFFAAQEAEDVDAYLALWSSTAPRLQQLQQLRMQLQFIFDSGDDKFSDVAILRVATEGARVRVRVSSTRARTRRLSDGGTATLRGTDVSSLTYVREGAALKLVSEGSPTDDLAEAYVAAATPAERDQVLASEPELVTDRLVQAVSRRADAAAQANRPAMALPIYERVLELARRIGDRRAEGQALQNIANAKYFLRNFSGALESYERRLSVEREAANDEGVVGALLGIATVKYATFDYSAALASYEEALRLQEMLKDEPGVAVTLLTTGNVRYLLGDYAAAIADHRRSRDAHRAMGNAGAEAKALEGLGRTWTAQGDYASALDAYGGVLKNAAAGSDRTAQGNAVQSIGEIHLRLGNLDTARKLFDESRAHFEAVGDLANVGRVWQAAALADLLAARFAAAEQEYGRSETTCAAGKDAPCVARAIVGLAFAQASQARFDDAIPTYGRAMAAFTALNQQEEAARAELGLTQALLGKKDYAAALVSAARVHQRASDGGIDDLLWRAGMVRARALRRLARPADALAAAEATVAVVQRLGRAALDRPGTSVPEDAGDALVLLALLHVEGGDAGAAFDAIEQRRALGARAALARHERDIARDMTPAERADERDRATSVASLDAQIDRIRALPQPDPARVASLERARAEAVAVRREQQQQLFDRLPDLRTVRGLGPPATTADLSRFLKDSATVLVQFAIDEDDLVVVTAGRSDEGIVVRGYLSAVSRQSLAERIARVLDPATLASAEQWRTASAELRTAVPAAAMDAIAAAARAVIVPDGVLWRVPFEALPVVGGGPLGEKTIVSYAGSLGALLRGADRAVPEPRRLLAVGVPDLSSAVRDRIRHTAPGWVLRSGEQADAEIARVAPADSEPPPVVIAGAAATESAFRAALPAATVVHVAAPFRISSASPLFSVAALGGGDASGAAAGDPAADGWLEAREVIDLAGSARVVVFSDGGATSTRDGASVIPMVGWAWQAAGVPAVAMSRWTAGAASTNDLLARFHAGLASGASPDAALRSAQTAIRANEATSAPWFWAGWMVVGR